MWLAIMALNQNSWLTLLVIENRCHIPGAYSLDEAANNIKNSLQRQRLLEG